MATNQGIITETFPPNERGRALGMTGTAVALGTMVGPTLGGLIVSIAPWKYIFLINIPIGILVYIGVIKILPFKKKASDFKIDVKGSILFMISITLLFTSINFGQSLGFTNMFIVMSFIIVSCGGSSSKDSKNVITINAGPQPKTIDPSLNTALDACYYVMHAFEGLTTKSKDGKIVGGAAESWEEFDNGTRYIFHLRTNAKWSDGKPVVAEDFVYSWQRVVDPAVGSQYSFQHEPVKNAKAITA